MKSRAFSVSISLISMCLVAFGQAATGTLTGIITDPAGAVLPNAAVEVKNNDTGFVYPTVTTNTGLYRVSQLPPGQYSLTVTAPGFKTYNRAGLTLAAAAVVPLDVTLDVGAPSESVTVTGEATLLKTQSSDYATNITVSSLDNLPILGIGTTNSGSSGVRNPYNMIQLIPGVGNYTANSQMVINGLGGFANTTTSFRVEGQDATNHLPTGYAVQENQPSADAIQEVAIQTSNYAAEFGTAGAAVLNLTMRSGGNGFHGSAYDYFVNEDLNAGMPFTISGGPGSPTGGDGSKYRPRNRRNDFGGTIGGPVWIPKLYDGHDKTFFFFNLERYVESNNYSFPLTVPTPAYLNGDFSAISPNGNCSLCSTYGIQQTPLGIPTPISDPLGRPIYANEIYDPNTRAVTSGNLGYANPFPGNTIPLTRFSATAIAMQKLFPAASTSSLTSNDTGSILGHRDSQIPAIKIDHSPTSRDKISFYFSKTGTEAQIAFPFGNADGLPIEIGQYRGTFIYAWTYRLNYDRTITPTTLLHLGGGYSQVNFGDQAPFLNFDPAQFGLSGFVIHRQFPSVVGMCAGVFGCTGYGGMQSIGTAAQIQTFNRGQRPTFNANITKVKGSHTYKMGGEVAFQGNLFSNFAGVTMTTGTGPTSQPFIPSGSLNGYSMGFGYASFLLGNFTQTQQTPQEDYRYGKTQYSFFLQDSWKVMRKLSLDYGVRYDLGTATRETYGRLGQFSPTTPNANANGTLGATIFANTCQCSFYAQTYPFAIGPRVGAAYQLTSKTVLRAGWGIVYQYTPDGVSGGIVGSNAVNTVPGINSFVNAQQAGFIQQPVWPVTNANVYPNVGTTTGAPVWADTNYYRPPRQNQWSIGIQQEVTHNLVLEGSYVANRQVWVPIGGPGGSGPLAAGNFISPSAYAQYGLYPYPGTGSPGYAYSSPSLAGKCVPGNDCDRFLLTQPVNSAAVIQKMGGLFLPYPSASPTTILQTALRPYPQFPFNNGSTTTVFAPQGSPTGNERYDSLQAKLTKRLSHGLQASGAFTWEKSFLRATRQDFFNASSSQWALQNLPPRVLTFNIVYTTPEVSHFKTHDKWVNQVLKDWQIGWFANYQSGTFLTPPTSNTANFLSSSMTRVPGQPLYLKELNCKCYNPYYDQVLNPAAWRNLPANATGTSTAVLYEDFRGPRHPQENANFGRNFKVNERFTLQFRGEFVNIFNRTIMPNPITNLNPTVPLTRNSLGILTNGFGVVNAYLTPNSQAGTTTSAQPGGAALAPRSGTLVLRLVF